MEKGFAKVREGEREEGAKEKAMDIARNRGLKRLGISHAEIADATGLNLNEIDSLS